MKKLKIVLADDLSRDSSIALQRSESLKKWGIFLSNRLKSSLELVHADAHLGTAHLATKEYQKLAKALHFKEKKGIDKDGLLKGKKVQYHYLSGHPVDALVAFFKKKPQASLVLFGTHGYTGAKKLILGSVSEELARYIQLPLFILGPHAISTKIPKDSSSLVVYIGIDVESEVKDQILKSIQLAKKLKPSKVVLVYNLFENLHPVIQSVLGTKKGQEKLKELVESLKEKAHLKLSKIQSQFNKNSLKTEILIDVRLISAADAILDAISSNEGSIVFLKKSTKGMFKKTFLGSTTRTVILESKTPVMIF